MERPPLGAKPEHIWIAQRINELASAIYNNLDHHMICEASYETITKWAEELRWRTRDMIALKKEKKNDISLD